MKSFVIVKSVPLVELFLAKLTGVLFHTIVHIHVVLTFKIFIQRYDSIFIPESLQAN